MPDDEINAFAQESTFRAQALKSPWKKSHISSSIDRSRVCFQEKKLKIASWNGKRGQYFANGNGRNLGVLLKGGTPVEFGSLKLKTVTTRVNQIDTAVIYHYHIPPEMYLIHTFHIADCCSVGLCMCDMFNLGLLVFSDYTQEQCEPKIKGHQVLF